MQHVQQLYCSGQWHNYLKQPGANDIQLILPVIYEFLYKLECLSLASFSS